MEEEEKSARDGVNSEVSVRKVLSWRYQCQSINVTGLKSKEKKKGTLLLYVYWKAVLLRWSGLGTHNSPRSASCDPHFIEFKP